MGDRLDFGRSALPFKRTSLKFLFRETRIPRPRGDPFHLLFPDSFGTQGSAAASKHLDVVTELGLSRDVRGETADW